MDQKQNKPRPKELLIASAAGFLGGVVAGWLGKEKYDNGETDINEILDMTRSKRTSRHKGGDSYRKRKAQQGSN